MTKSPLKQLDYSVLQQCIHCGLCLPVCPTYDATHIERNSPRGRISLMRSIADNQLEPTKTFGEEMSFCLGCLACETACPAGVDYAQLFEAARAEAEQSGRLATPQRTLLRGLLLRGLFTRPRLLRFAGRLVRFYQQSGLQSFIRALHLTALLPRRLRDLEKQMPHINRRFSAALIPPALTPILLGHRVGLLTGCVQDLTFSGVNRDTADVLLANNCAVVTPSLQFCCGSLHSHNGDLESARQLARHNIDSFDLDNLDAIITNAAGCGSHLKHYDRLLADDPQYAARAIVWSEKVKDIHEWLVEIGFRAPKIAADPQIVTYHEACHLCHGQKISRQPRQLLESIPGLKLVELVEATWCCGSAGIYNITQPDMSRQLLERKMDHIQSTGASIVATGNPGCLLQLSFGMRERGLNLQILHPVSLLARAYRRESLT
jgi:glycolate oxidase iron-sulfur subunit